MIYGKYGKVENRALTPCEMPFLLGGEKTWSTDPVVLKRAGFYPVVRTERPVREGYEYAEYWVLENEACVQKWEEHEVNGT